MQEKRIKLFKDFRKIAERDQDLTFFDNKYKNFSDWEDKNFLNASTAKDIWNKSLLEIYSGTLDQFYKKFCCDLQWAKDSGYCGDSSPQPPVPQPVKGGKCESVTYTEDDILNGVAKIKNCMKGDVVGKIQNLLKTCGFPYFSKYGPKTEKMVMAFQELPNSGLSDDGVVGKYTYKKLQSCKTSSTTTSPTTTTTTTAPIKVSDPSIDDIIGIFD